MAVLSKTYTYSKIQKEDHEEIQHRLAQFLIYKTMKRVDGMRRPSWLRVKMFKLKIKIGKRLKKIFIRKALFSVKGDLLKQIITHLLKSCKLHLHGKKGIMINKNTSPSVFY